MRITTLTILNAFFRLNAKKLGAELVVSSHGGCFDNADRRVELQNYLKKTFGVKSFFTKQANG